MRVENNLSTYSVLSPYCVRIQQPNANRRIEAAEPVKTYTNPKADVLELSEEGLALAQGNSLQSHTGPLTYSAPPGYLARKY